jgi:hypothetical protein
MQNMKKLVERWTAESPAFFKKLRKIALGVGGSLAAAVTANSIFGLALNSTLVTVLGYGVAVCAAIAGTAQLTRNDNP